MGGVELDNLCSIMEKQKLKMSLGLPLESTILISVGEVNKNKNHGVVIKALQELENCCYVICGSGPLIEYYKQLSNRLGVDDRVFFAGYRTDVEKMLSIGDIFVFPSIREGLGLALIEAMASGLICIVSKNRGSNDLLNGSKLLFNPHDSHELAALIRDVIRDNYNDEIEQNYHTIKEYSIDNTLKIIRNIYLEQLQ